MPPIGRYLQRYQGLVDGDGTKDSSLYFDQHGIVVDALGRGAGAPAFRVRGINASTNAPTTLFQVNKDGAVSWVGAPVDVRTFGAKGDGVTDDTAAIRLAVAAATATGGGGVVWFPGGPSTTYLIGPSGATYSLTLFSSLTLRGEGAVLQRKAANAEILVGAASALTDVRLEGLTLDNQDAVVAGGGLLYVPNGSSRISVQRVRFVRLAYAVAVLVDTGTTQGSQVRFTECEFLRTLANSTAANENTNTLQILDASDVSLERCRFKTCNGVQILANNATACPASSPMRYVVVRGCSFEGIKTTNLFVEPGGGTAACLSHVLIEGNLFASTGKEIEKGAIAVGNAVTATGETHHVVIRNNQIRDWGYSGSSSIGAAANAAPAIVIGGQTTGLIEGVVVEGNQLDGATFGGTVPPTGNYGVAVGQNVKNLTIVGNTIQNCGYDGVWLTSSTGAAITHAVVVANVVRLCALHTDSTLRGGGIHVVDYVNDVVIADNVCVDNGSDGSAGTQAAGIAIDTGATATSISDVSVKGNTCYDTRASGGSKKQLYGVRVGFTGSADSAQPTRVFLLDNTVGTPDGTGGNGTAGLYYQSTVDLGYVVRNNAGYTEAWVAFAPTWTGFSANPTVTSRYTQVGKVVVWSVQTTGNGTSNATGLTATLPVAAQAARSGIGFAVCIDNGANLTTAGRIDISTTVATFYTNAAATAWTNAGAKAVYFTITYEAA